MLLKAIRDGEVKAVLLKMGNSIRDIDIKKGIRRDRSAYVRFQADQQVASAFAHPTEPQSVAAGNIRLLGAPRI
jgi:hypothetical protein